MSLRSRQSSGEAKPRSSITTLPSIRRAWAEISRQAFRSIAREVTMTRAGNREASTSIAFSGNSAATVFCTWSSGSVHRRSRIAAPAAWRSALRISAGLRAAAVKVQAAMTARAQAVKRCASDRRWFLAQRDSKRVCETRDKQDIASSPWRSTPASSARSGVLLDAPPGFGCELRHREIDSMAKRRRRAEARDIVLRRRHPPSRILLGLWRAPQSASAVPLNLSLQAREDVRAASGCRLRRAAATRDGASQCLVIRPTQPYRPTDRVAGNGCSCSEA